MRQYSAVRGFAWPAVLVLAALIAFGVYFFFRSMAEMKAMEREAAAPPPAGMPAAPEGAHLMPAASAGAAEPAYALRLRDLEGRAVSLADYKGKPVFVTFWATWCGYCKAEMPSIQKLYESMKGEDVVFLMVSSEDKGKFGPFMEKNRYTLPSLQQVGDLPAVYRTQGIPATFILDKQGKIAHKQVGAMDWDNDEIRKLLRDLAKS